MSERKFSKRLSKRIAEAKANTCVRCGYSREAHELGNYSDGNLIGRTFLVCPTAIAKFPSDVAHD